MEAVDCGAKLLLIDEDRSATNFMIRDRMMKELIEKERVLSRYYIPSAPRADLGM